jgi:hypothetical protein
MANSNTPFGFSHVGYRDGFTPNYSPTIYKIVKTNTNKIYRGDPVYLLTAGAGYIDTATPGTSPILGIFDGCTYRSTVTKETVFSKWWPGSGADADVDAYIMVHEKALFRVKTASAAVGQADIGANIQFAYGTGNQSTGLSGAYVTQSSINTTDTLPFRIHALVTDPVGTNGTDTSSAYNDIIVGFNNLLDRTNTGQ